MLPPLERLAQAVSLAALAYGLLGAEVLAGRQRADAGLLLAAALAALLFAYTAQQRIVITNDEPFNALELARVWSALTLALALFAAAAIIVYRTVVIDAPLKLLPFGIIAVGSAYDFWQLSVGAATGDFLGSARLTFAAAMALAPLICGRRLLTLMDEENAEAEAALVVAQAEASNQSVNDEVSLSQALISILGAHDTAELARRVTETAAHSLGVEARLLIRDDDRFRLSLDNAEDAAREIELPLTEHRQLRQALESGEAFDITEAESLASLRQTLDIQGSRAITILPLARTSEALALLVCSAPGDLELNKERLSRLAVLADSASMRLGQIQPGQPDRHLDEEMKARNEADRNESESLRSQIKTLVEEHDALLDSREALRRDFDSLNQRYAAQGKDKEALLARIDGMRAQLDQGESTAKSLRGQLQDMAEERDNLLRIRDQLTARLSASVESVESADEEALRDELMILRDNVASLMSEREELALKLGEAQREAPSSSGVDRHDGESLGPLIAKIHSIGAPIAAISDCADILLAESMGLLGAAQRQVLARMTVNLAHLAELLDDLMRISQSDAAHFAPEYVAVDMVALLDGAMTEKIDLIRGRGLSLDLSIEDDLQPIAADAPCIQHIVSCLINNACLVSPEGSEIRISLGTNQEQQAGKTVYCMRLSVQDRGGGMKPSDIERVFARRYSHEYAPIEGFADDGVTLAVAKAFALAHGGDLRIEPGGDGSIISLDLPLPPPCA